MKVYTKERGIRKLKEGINFSDYKAKCPTAIRVNVPSIKTLEKWTYEGYCKTPDGCIVEPDGSCSHGFDSWLLIMNLI